MPTVSTLATMNAEILREKTKTIGEMLSLLDQIAIEEAHPCAAGAAKAKQWCTSAVCLHYTLLSVLLVPKRNMGCNMIDPKKKEEGCSC